MTRLRFADWTYAVIGASMEVYNCLGPGFLEAVYQEALEVELGARAIPFRPQAELRIVYKGRPLKKSYVADFVTHEEMIVEIKAIPTITSREEAQLLNYLRATRSRIGLLVNFGAVGGLQWKRLLL